MSHPTSSSSSSTPYVRNGSGYNTSSSSSTGAHMPNTTTLEFLRWKIEDVRLTLASKGTRSPEIVKAMEKLNGIEKQLEKNGRFFLPHRLVIFNEDLDHLSFSVLKPSQKMDLQITVIHQMRDILSGATLSTDARKEVLKLFHKLPLQIQDQLAICVFIHKEAPYKHAIETGYAEIEANPLLLTAITRPMLSPRSGSLLDQAINLMEVEQYKTAAKEASDALAQIKAMFGNPAMTQRDIEQAVERLEPRLSAAIQAEVPFNENFSEPDVQIRLIAKIDVLKELMDGYPAGADYAKRETQIAMFNELFRDPTVNHRQLKYFYNMMPKDVQASLPQPPFYGHGVNSTIYNELGAHISADGSTTTFNLYAPNARNVALCLTNGDVVEHQIALVKDDRGVWSAATDRAPVGRSYYYQITGADGVERTKVDPVGFGALMHAGGARIAYDKSSTTFRLFAPSQRNVTLCLTKDGVVERRIPLENDGQGLWRASLGTDVIPFMCIKDEKGKEYWFTLNSNARNVTLCLTQDGVVKRRIPLKIDEKGVWRASVDKDVSPLIRSKENWFTLIDDRVNRNRTYYYLVTGEDGVERMMEEPVGLGFVSDPDKAHDGGHDYEWMESVVSRYDRHVWNDADWMAKRKDFNPVEHPLNAYEVHVHSWRKHPDGSYYTYRELAHELADYCESLNYTHVELMGFFDHPHDPSMGYQVTGYFAPNSRMGTIEDVQYMVDYLHQRNIGVLVDAVPDHYSSTDRGLSQLDGTNLYESNYLAGQKRWSSGIFGHEKPFVQDFLISHMRFLKDICHVDGVRVDAVWDMLHLEAGGKKRTNYKGDNRYFEAQLFMRNLNTILHEDRSGFISIAEESSSNMPHLLVEPTQRWHGDPTHKSNGKLGLGCDLQWHLGLMNDILYEFIDKSYQNRPNCHGRLVHTIERVEGCLPKRLVFALSHDECANGKRSTLTKMPKYLVRDAKGKVVRNSEGNEVEDRSKRFENAKALYLYQICHPGAKLNMMGNELAQSAEWHGRLKESLDPGKASVSAVQWEELDPSVDIFEHHRHQGVQACCARMNALYKAHPALWRQGKETLQIISTSDKANNVIAFHRRGSGQQIACVFNFSPRSFESYEIDLPPKKEEPKNGERESVEDIFSLKDLESVEEIFCTDSVDFAGSTATSSAPEIIRNEAGYPIKLRIRLPALSGIVFQERFRGDVIPSMMPTSSSI